MTHAFKIKDRYPAIEDLRQRARCRIPEVAFEYLECGTGREETVTLNEKAFASIRFLPRFFAGLTEPETAVEIFGQRYSSPFGVAPMGMASLIWPGAELKLAHLSAKHDIPFCMSTSAAETMETIAEAAEGNAWFQLYPTRNLSLRDRIIERADALGFKVLVLTVDVPTPSVRERQKRAGLSVPARKDLSFWWSILRKPSWAISTLLRGEPRFLTLEAYVSTAEMENQSQFFAEQLGGTLDWGYFSEVRSKWKGPLVVKGILHPDDAEMAIAAGADGVWISNHGGRQFDACPPAVNCIAPIRKRVGASIPLIYDSGIRSGLDAMRAIHEGADFIFVGRPFAYGVASNSQSGAAMTLGILERDLINSMIQTGCKNLADIKALNKAS